MKQLQAPFMLNSLELFLGSNALYKFRLLILTFEKSFFINWKYLVKISCEHTWAYRFTSDLFKSQAAFDIWLL